MSKDKPFDMKPDAGVQTTWKVICSIVVATAVVVGGLVSIKTDIANADRNAKEAKQLAEETKKTVDQMRDELLRLRIALGVYDLPSTAVKQPPKDRQP